MEEYKFYGLDKRTNLYLNISAGIVVGIIIITLSLVFWFKFAFISPRFSIVLSAFIGFSVVILLLKLIHKKISKEWKFILNNNKLSIYYNQNLIDNIFIEDFNSITLRGDMRNPKSNSRYLTLKNAVKSLKIIVTNSFYMPFSTLEDIEHFDVFIKELDKELAIKFVKKDRRKLMTPKGILNYHYVKK